jgi:hypothetical protein
LQRVVNSITHITQVELVAVYLLSLKIVSSVLDTYRASSGGRCDSKFDWEPRDSMGSVSSFGCAPFADSVGIVDGIETDEAATSFTPAMVALLASIYMNA